MAMIEVKNLSKIYGKGESTVTALEDINLNVEEGQFVAVMGPSGCGKSTLLHLIGGLDRPTTGKVYVDNQDVFALDDARLTELRRRKIGLVFQFFNLIPVLTAVENAALPLLLDGVNPSEARGKASDWLAKGRMGERLNHRPDELSGGQQQQVAIARAMVADPVLILADEPTGNLDSRASDEIASSLRRLVDDYHRTVLMVTHDPRIAAYADRIIFLKDGRIVDDSLMTGDNGRDVKQLKEKVESL